MAVRSREQLRRDQAELLDDYRLGRTRSGTGVATEAKDDGLKAAFLIGRITAVVTLDETHGPHLMVKVQRFSDRPPTASDSTLPTRVAYPTPNLTVGDYKVDELVALWIAKGAELAVKL